MPNKTVLALVDDLFWRAKIEHATKSAQANIVFLSDPGELAGAADPGRVGAVLVDLSLRNDPFPALAAWKVAPETKGIPVIGYYEHLRRDLKEKATEAGLDQVLPRSSFAERLADIILAYALPGGVRTSSEEQELPEE